MRVPRVTCMCCPAYAGGCYQAADNGYWQQTAIPLAKSMGKGMLTASRCFDVADAEYHCSPYYKELKHWYPRLPCNIGTVN